MNGQIGGMSGGNPGSSPERDVKDDRSYIQEIRGTLFSLNDFLSKAQAHYRFEGINKPKDRRHFKDFYMYLYKLTVDARELIEENDPRLLGYLDKWLAGMEWVITNEQTPEVIWKWFTTGEKLALKLERTLYQLGIKDSNVSQRVGFPFALVERMVEMQKEEILAEKEKKRKEKEESK
jgi:hypothetical protein